MISLLLDENLSPAVARQLTGRRPMLTVMSIHHWQSGHYMGRPDEDILYPALPEGLTLVTYDQKTILPFLMRRCLIGADHAGVVFIDDRSIASNSFGEIVRALAALWDASHSYNWTNRVVFLRPAP